MHVDAVVLRVDYGKGDFYMILRRHLAPQTVSRIEGVITIEKTVRTRGIIRSNRLFMNLKIGAVPKEKSRTTFKKGEVAYWIQSSALCIFLEDQNDAPSMNPIGTVIHLNEQEIKKLPLGSIMSIVIPPDNVVENILDEQYER